MFKENSKAIYLQIVDRICDEILAGNLSAGDRLPSVREYAASVQVNPNTMMRAYEHLSNRNVIFNRRGIGYFLSDEAHDIVLEMKRDELLGSEINEVFRQLQLLGITPQTLFDRYQQFLSASKVSDNL